MLIKRGGFVATLPATQGDQRLAFATVAVSALIFLAAIPFAKQPLGQVWAFIPAYQAALVVCDLVTAVLLYGQARFSRSRALLVLASGYLFTAALAVVHALSFPGLFAPRGVLGGGAQSTAWLYMFWHAGFPLTVIAYAALKRGADLPGERYGRQLLGTLAVVVVLTVALTLLATSGEALLPPIMHGNRYTPAMIVVVGAVWLLSLAALIVLWRARAYTVLDLWLMVVMCAWLFDIGLSAVFNAGRFDLGFYAGRLYGLAASVFVLGVLLLENGALHGRLALQVSRHEERLRILAAIDRAVVAEQSPDAIVAAVIQPLRELLDVPRAIVNRFDFPAGEVEWVAAAGRRRTHVGPGVRYPLGLMGDIEELRRGEAQLIDVDALPPGPHTEALLASGVRWYLAVPMIAGGELIGAISFGGETKDFQPEQVSIAHEVATQLAIATMMKAHAAELESRVRARTAELDDLYNNAPCGYHSVDENGLIVRMNDTWLRWLGYERSEVVGRKRHADLMTPESAQRFWSEAFPLFKRQGWLKEFEFDYVRKDGSTFPGSLQTSTVYDAQGRYVMSRTTVFDISARKDAEEKVRSLNKELESFSYSVSHDLRAPLRAIDGYARMLEEDYAAALDAEAQRLLGVVRSNARRMGQLIDDLLAFSRLGKQAAASAPVDMTRLAREAAEELRGSRTVELAPLPQAKGDAALLKQVWLNFVGNALKYSSKKAQAKVEIGGREEARENVYWVRDNGAGFDMRYADKLFGVFQRLHRAEEFEGTGIGLAIVQRVVTRHGGRVWAEGKAGEGACFYFALPKG